MNTHLVRAWRECRGFALFIVLMAIFRSALADWNVVPTGSMKPTILEGDRILVNKLAYDFNLPPTHISMCRFADPLRGDIVVFDSKAADTRLVKRVIGLPGETVQMKDDRLIIDSVDASYSSLERRGETLFATESYDRMSHRIELSSGGSPLATFGPIKVLADCYLVLGDNRDNSADSRIYGFIPRREIVGNAKSVVYSLDYDHSYVPRADRFFRSL